jgi:DNA-binding MarR family transcriptional regulator
LSKQELIRELQAEIRSAQVAVAARDHAIAERLGINATDHRCLDVLDQRGPLTAGALAAALQLSRSAVTTVIDRLEALHYVRRVPGRDDRRQVLVELTPLLVRRALELYGGGDEGADLLDRYTTGELSLLRDFVRADREYNERRAAQLNASRARRTRGRAGGRR